MKILLLSIGLIAIAFMAIGVKMFFIKGGEFKKECSSVDPNTGEKFGCSCGNNAAEKCDN